MRFYLFMVFLFVIAVAVMGHLKEKKIAFDNNKIEFFIFCQVSFLLKLIFSYTNCLLLTVHFILYILVNATKTVSYSRCVLFFTFW